jgi:hypothetical protein
MLRLLLTLLLILVSPVVAGQNDSRQAIRTLTSPTPVTIHSVFDSQGRRIAEYNEATGALIREYVWNGWEPVAVIEGGVIRFRTNDIGRPEAGSCGRGPPALRDLSHRDLGQTQPSGGPTTLGG